MLWLGGYHSCLEIQKRANIDADGEYEMLIGGKNTTIYCHKMNTTQPREYITLPMGEEQNYSEVYGMRLVAPDSCPNNGTRDNCPCVEDRTPRAGLTVWNKVHLNVTILTLDCKCCQNIIIHTNYGILQLMISHSPSKFMDR